MPEPKTPGAPASDQACEKAPGRDLPFGPVLDSRTLFCFGKVVNIQHSGERYVLRLTRSGKLILTK